MRNGQTVSLYLPNDLINELTKHNGQISTEIRRRLECQINTLKNKLIKDIQEYRDHLNILEAQLKKISEQEERLLEGEQ